MCFKLTSFDSVRSSLDNVSLVRETPDTERNWGKQLNITWVQQSHFLMVGLDVSHRLIFAPKSFLFSSPEVSANIDSVVQLHNF